MPEPLPGSSASKPMTEIVSAKQQRKLQARHDPPRIVWFGLGMFGLVGWSIAIPTLIGVTSGLWIDRRWPSQYSWTLMLMFTGLVVGCYHAWRWVHHEGMVPEDSEVNRAPATTMETSAAKPLQRRETPRHIADTSNSDPQDSQESH